MGNKQSPQIQQSSSIAENKNSDIKHLHYSKASADQLESLLVRRRKDGSKYKSRREMINNYKLSHAPYPLSVFLHLDYCTNIIKSHLTHGFIFSLPLSLIVSYALNPEVREKGFMSKNKYYYIVNFGMCYFLFIIAFTIDSMVFSDYCKPWSNVYSLGDDYDEYFVFMKNRIKKEQEKMDIQLKKTRLEGLRDEDL